MHLKHDAEVPVVEVDDALHAAGHDIPVPQREEGDRWHGAAPLELLRRTDVRHGGDDAGRPVFTAHQQTRGGWNYVR